MTEEARSWRRLAVAGAAAVGLLTWRVLTGYRAAHPLVPGEHLPRRVGALEDHLADLEDRIGPVVSWFDDDRPCGQRR